MATVSTPTAAFTSQRYRLQPSCRSGLWIICDLKNGNRAIGPWTLSFAEDYFDKLVAQEQRELAAEEAKKAAKAVESKPAAKPLFPVAKESCRVSEPCWTCGKLITARPSSESNTCNDCRRSAAEAEANSLKGALADLLRGTGVFSVLSVAERGEQVSALLDVQQMDAETLIGFGGLLADAIAARLGEIAPRSVLADKPFPRTCPEGEWKGGPAPDRITRFELEGRIEIDASEADEPHGDDVPVVLRFPTEPDYRPAA